MSTNTLVIGASGGIGRALVDTIRSRQADSRITAISRDHDGERDQREGIDWISSDYSESNIEKICARLLSQHCVPSSVFICNGVLHGEDFHPEKRLEAFDPEAFTKVIATNARLPLLWLKHLLPLLRKSERCVVTVFSARVGSIGDNRLGGWYSYRASKAALNMLLQTTAVELARRLPQVKLLAFHPGTTDTALSKPFQNNVPEGKLFPAEFVAERLLGIVDSLEPDGVLSYLDWQGKPIPW